MRYCIIISCLLSLCIKVTALDIQKILTVKGSPFSVSASKNLEVRWKGENLVVGDMHSWIANQNVGSSSEIYEASKGKGWQYTNVWSEKSPLPFRRETGISPDGKKIEINFQSHQDALMTSYPSPTISYTIFVPLPALKNSTWEALTGRSYNAKWSSGTLNSETPDGNFIGASARWISFTTPRGKITFDFNPHGVTTYYVDGANTVQSQWSVKKRGDMIEMTFSVPATNYGGALTSKLVIFEGDKTGYLKHHAVTYYHYFSEIPKEQLFCFGGKSTSEFINAGTKVYNADKGYGWKNADGLFETGGDMTGALYTSVKSSKNNSFITSNLRPGLYLITLRSGALADNIGPFNVSLNGEKVFSNIKVDKGNVANLTCVRWIEEGKADLNFEGNWAACVLGYQLFMHTEEDFEFRRGFWIRNDGFCPDVLFSNYYNAAPVYGKSISFSPLSGKVEEINSVPELPELETALPDQKSKELSWRYTSPLGTMGPDNYGSFNEFNTPAIIKKRLEQVKDGGAETIILNGFLSRHTFPTHLKRVEENIRQTVETGHKMGMKFLDHQDLTILWNMDMGFRFLAEHPEFLQHAQTNGLPTWGICPINPLFKDGYFFPYILDFIRNTNIDGLMIDECTFHFDNFCNCDYCKAAFTKATGLILPDDETSPLLKNRTSKLWKAWIEWRKNAIAQWRIDFSKAAHNINPGFCNIQYYSEGGFMQDYASYRQGGDLALSAKSMDFLGTEIMSRDVWDDFRYNFASRHVYNSLHETYGSPVFGLVYPVGQINYAIIGWAMNNMLAQVTWSMVDYTGFKKMDDYTGWKENMNNISATPFADIAIIFSRKTRDWSPKNKDTHANEIMGISQFFTEHHIQHTFILDDALLNQDLSRFRVLLAPSMDCISEEQVAKLKQYVLNGGILYLTGESGHYTSFGEPRTKWAFADVNGNDSQGKAVNNDLSEINYGKGKILYTPNRYGLNDFCKSFTLENTYEFSPDPDTTALNENILRQVIGPKLSFEAVNIPSKVLTSVYNETLDGKNLTLVHLLNATGVKAKNGDILPLPDPTWETIKGDMTFEISLPSISDSYYATPDSPGHKPVKAEKISDGRYKIEVPEGTVEKYGIVYIVQD
ncbi:MAG: beta-galactosidase trimerization domain-containing protein [Bacteroidales bacterium]|nr:beta-galactosidase trimerization domain-containing protein [Bacteroidales bacterium]